MSHKTTIRFTLASLVASASLLTACVDAAQETTASAQQVAQVKTDGQLPPHSDQLLAEEWKLYQASHPELDEATARKQFNAIQVLSAKARDAFPQRSQTAAAWAERRALANAYLKNKIEDVYSPESLPDEMIQAAIDAYAFNSGHPKLVTASHLLVRPSSATPNPELLAAIQEAHARLAKLSTPTNDDLNREAVALLRAGYNVDVNLNLEFPVEPMRSFMGEKLPYNEVVTPFAEAAAKLNHQAPLSPVTETQFGYHIILFQSATPMKKPEMKEVKQYMVTRIVDQGRRAAASQFISALEQNSDLRINDKKLKELTYQSE